MYYYLRILLMLVLFVNQEADSAIAVRKFVYQKDMSEYCRRRVMPSVFLGRQVVDAYSQIMHFSRLELPYSCFVSIRTETGSNIILVIQLMSDKKLIESCRESKNQLLVYDIDETFGGYWGALPDNMIKPEMFGPVTTHENQYFLKTTQAATTATTTVRTTPESTKPFTIEKSAYPVQKLTSPEDEIVVEVPLVNVSAIVVPGGRSSDNLFDIEESFDTMIDVKPKPGESYKTTVLPLLQFAMSNEDGGWRSGAVGTHGAGALRYEVDLNGDLFTPDARLSYPLLRLSTGSKQRGKYKSNVNSRLDFKKNKKLLAQKEALFHKTFWPHHKPISGLQPEDLARKSTQKEIKHDSNPFEVVDAILKNLSKTKDEHPTPNIEIDKDVSNLLQGLAKIGHNESAYLFPEATLRPPITTRLISTKYRNDEITWRQPSGSYRTNYLEDIEDTLNVEGLSEGVNNSFSTVSAVNNNHTVIIDIGKSGPLLPTALDIDQVINVTHRMYLEKNEKSTIIHPDTLALEVNGTTTSVTTPEIVKPMTLVDHESWDNMVQAASLMAVMLNQSVTSRVGEKQGLNGTPTPPRNEKSRKKRYIHAIPISDAKPRHLPVSMQYPSTKVSNDKVYDAQEFRQFIERQDDEIKDRVALRYMRQYVGPVLFNICDFNDATARHVYLFNSSRLVLAISNFTLEGMTVVMTPARTLLRSDSFCAPECLECQVSGARVCIDSLSACDGVPNCGSYDIYDEDRLKCGGSAGLQHNVFLAAFTLLAMLLTLLYTVHYWLKRCVPKVSDAFFIYTDAAENVLYLDPIMRSPYDTDDGYSKGYFRNAALQDYNMEYTDMQIQKKTIGSYFSRLCRLFRCKRKTKKSRVLDDQIIEEEYIEIGPKSRRCFSFAEEELSKMGTVFGNDVAVQTGESLEMQVMDNTRMEDDLDYKDIVPHYQGTRRSSDMRSTFKSEMLFQELSDELSFIHFFRKARSVSMQMSSSFADKDSEMLDRPLPVQREEKEIQCLEYDYSIISPLTESEKTGKANNIQLESGQTRKQLRFEEETTMIEISDDDGLDEEVVVNQRRPRSSVYGGGNVHPEHRDSHIDVGEPSTSTNREFKSYFWGSSKNKSKKPKKLFK